MASNPEFKSEVEAVKASLRKMGYDTNGPDIYVPDVERREVETFLVRFKQMVMILMNMNHVHVTHFKTFDPVTMDLVRKVQQTVGVKLDPAIVAFYKQTNGLQLRWVDDRDEDHYNPDMSHSLTQSVLDFEDHDLIKESTGIVNIRPLEEVFLPSRMGDPATHFNDPSDGKELCPGTYADFDTTLGHVAMNMRAFDLTNSNNFATLYLGPVKQDLPRPCVVMANEGGSDWESSLLSDFETYLESIIATAGIAEMRANLYLAQQGHEAQAMSHHKLTLDISEDSIYDVVTDWVKKRRKPIQIERNFDNFVTKNEVTCSWLRQDLRELGTIAGFDLNPDRAVMKLHLQRHNLKIDIALPAIKVGTYQFEAWSTKNRFGIRLFDLKNKYLGPCLPKASSIVIKEDSGAVVGTFHGVLDYKFKEEKIAGQFFIHNLPPELAGETVVSDKAPKFEEAKKCHCCDTTFTLVNRRHHCRHCGRSCCGDDSGDRIRIPKYNYTKPVRVCVKCMEEFKGNPFTFSYNAHTPGSPSTPHQGGRSPTPVSPTSP